MDTQGLAYPITKHPLGLLHSSKNLDVLKSDLIVLLLTNPGERVMLPGYGTPLRRFIFEQNDTGTSDEIEEVIADSIRTWEPRVAIEAIEVTSDFPEDELNADDTLGQREHILGIKIKFFDPNKIAIVDELKLDYPSINLTKYIK